MDAAQNLYVGNAGTGTNITCASGAGTCSNLLVYAPPYTGAPIVTPNVPNRAYRKITMTATQLFATSVSGGAGLVDVFTLPITAASTPATQILTGVNTPEGIAVDAAGNLYAGNLTDATISVYMPPYNSSSIPVLIY